MNKSPQFSLALFIVAVTVMLSLIGWGAGLYLDWLWFNTVNYSNIFVTMLLSEYGLRILIGWYFLD
ncbi:hypothetical protein N752_13845 [Desulforamulus aquiferis]|nr:hypothetical protein N752_13845 [Desulforamulus aquiferis]